MFEIKTPNEIIISLLPFYQIKFTFPSFTNLIYSSFITQVGKEGVITVKDGKTLQDEMEIIEGKKLK